MMMPLLSLAASLLIVASDATHAKPEWRGVIDALAAKHADAGVEVATVSSVTNALNAIRKVRPRYLAFVMCGDELGEQVIRQLHRMVRDVDDDPFDDAVWGIVTGPTARDAKRMATSRKPSAFTTALGTTGYDLDLVPGAATLLSDANPPGVWKVKRPAGKGQERKVEEHVETGDMSHAFVFGWNDDPDLLLTSSHATEHNLEMPFSRGNIVAKDGRFVATCGLPLAEPRREKVWIAAGNCLIANPWPQTLRTPQTFQVLQASSMLMTALGWGRVNQFVGYTVETWFGEIGWNTWRYFNAYRLPLNLCWYAANQNLVRSLAAAKPGSQERKGKLWDMDGTAFYGDPMQAIALPPLDGLPKWSPDALPLLYLFRQGEDRKPFSADWDVFEADDFALVLRWSE